MRGSRHLLDAIRARRLSSTTELLGRLRSALPSMNRWIDDLHTAHEHRSRSVSELGYSGLSASFPSWLLEATRVAMVERVPFPPVSALGLPELEAMAKSRMAGITFRTMYFVDGSSAREHVHFHELVHVIQWRALGSDDFLLTYGTNLLLHGYARNPLEALAFGLEAQSKRGSPPSNISELVASEALRARGSAVAIFRECGLDFGR